jgi:hypothetical protein
LGSDRPLLVRVLYRLATYMQRYISLGNLCYAGIQGELALPSTLYSKVREETEHLVSDLLGAVRPGADIPVGSDIKCHLLCRFVVSQLVLLEIRSAFGDLFGLLLCFGRFVHLK